MERIEKAEYEKRLERLGEIYSGIMGHADHQALFRCPYKNRFDQCTAKFGCRNKRKPKMDGQLPVCTADDKIDYRPAWEMDPESYDKAREELKTIKNKSTNKQSETLATVSFEDRQCPAIEGQTIFDHADVLGTRVPTSCRRVGGCHECIIEIKQGMEALCPRTQAESFLRDNYRLSCQAVIEDPAVDIEFGLIRRSPKILTTQEYREVELDPLVTKRGDSVYYGDEKIDRYRGHIYGLAMDLGTTTVAAELVDLETGKPVYSTSFENPQRFGGSDIMRRISYDVGECEGELHRSIINTLNTELQEMYSELEITREQLYEIVIVGNSTMRELFFGLDVQSIGQKPYKSEIENEYLEGKRDSTSLTETTRSLRIQANKKARAFGAPLIASHVGADVVADLVAIDMDSKKEVVMLVDAGTNTEVVIGNADRLMAASCPAGPAFEGGLVTYGMPGCDGAIESIQYEDGQFKYETIGNTEPRGLCGSGLIDLLAELSRNDLMTPKGVFADKIKEFPIVPEFGITLTRNDASELAQAKAANYCGQIILMRNFGVTPDEISNLYLAGGFANYVDSDSAIDIGFLAPVPKDRIVKVGNAALQGAREMLLSKRKRESIERLIKTVEHVELETMPDFFDVFVEGCQFKPMKIPVAPAAS